MDILESYKKEWKKEEEEYLINNYSKKSDKELAKTLDRTISAIKYKAHSLRLYKDKEFICKARKNRIDLNITEELLINLYHIEKKSMRKIAHELSVGKTTIEYYLKKYNIKRRTHSEANVERFKWDTHWIKNASRYKLKKSAEKCTKTWIKKKKAKIKKFEEIHKISLKKFLEISYRNKKMNLSEIGRAIGFGRVIVSELLEEYKITKRPNFEHIASIKSKDRYQYGRTWEDLFGKQEALIRKKKTSLRSRRSIIKRLQNEEMPFSNTKIELMIKKELENRNIYFKFQQPMYYRFVCDFVLPRHKIVIECDGDFFHANPKIYNRKSSNLSKIQIDGLRRDKLKDKFLTKKGWTVLRFFESEIKEDTSKCIDKLFDIINSGKKDCIPPKSRDLILKESKFNVPNYNRQSAQNGN